MLYILYIIIIYSLNIVLYKYNINNDYSNIDANINIILPYIYNTAIDYILIDEVNFNLIDSLILFNFFIINEE